MAGSSCAASVTQLRHDAPAGAVHAVHDALPAVALRPGVQTRHVDGRQTARLHVGHLGDDEPRRGALRVVGRHERGGHPVGGGAIARHGRHDDPRGQRNRAEGER